MNDIKASVTLTGPIDVLAKLLASLGGGVSVAAVAPAPMIPPGSAFIPQMNAEDDESGDTAVAPGTVDKNGIPWDDRIHSTPAKLTGKGVWRAKRGVSDALTAQVEAELRARGVVPAAMATPAPVMTMPPGYPAPQPMPMPPAPAPVMTAPPAPVMTAPPAPVMTAPPAPVMTQPPAPAPVAAPTDFNSFMQGVQSLINMNKVDAAYFGELVGRVNVAAGTQFGAITDLASRPDLISWVWSVMQQDGRA